MAEENQYTEEQPKNNEIPWLKEHQWKPGQSGNPGGKAKGTLSLTAAIKAKYANEGLDSLLTAIDKIVEKGDMAVITEIWNRLDGKVSDRVELHGTMLIATPDQLDFAINALLEDKARLDIKLLEEGKS